MHCPRWVAIMCIGLLAAGCNGDGQATTRTTEADTTTTSTTTTTTVPTTTTFPIAGPEPWTDIVRDLYERSWQLAANPDPNAVATVYSPDCDCYAPAFQGAQDLVARGEHFEGEPPRPIAAMLTGEGGGGFQRVIVKVEIGARRIVNASGVVEEFAPGGQVCESILLQASGPGDTYRIHDFFVPQTCPAGL